MYKVGDKVWMRFNNRQTLLLTIKSGGFDGTYTIQEWGGICITENCITEMYNPLRPGKGLIKHIFYNVHKLID